MEQEDERGDCGAMSTQAVAALTEAQDAFEVILSELIEEIEAKDRRIATLERTLLSITPPVKIGEVSG